MGTLADAPRPAARYRGAIDGDPANGHNDRRQGTDMSGTARTLKLTFGSFAIIIALTLAIVPMPPSGLRTQRAAAAPVETNDFGSKALFKEFCKTLGGTFSEGKYSTECALPDGNIYSCDETAKNCTFFAKKPPIHGRINTGRVNGTLTTTGTGGAQPTPTPQARTDATVGTAQTR
jgi:putative hemolysin